MTTIFQINGEYIEINATGQQATDIALHTGISDGKGRRDICPCQSIGGTRHGHKQPTNRVKLFGHKCGGIIKPIFYK